MNVRVYYMYVRVFVCVAACGIMTLKGAMVGLDRRAEVLLTPV